MRRMRFGWQVVPVLVLAAAVAGVFPGCNVQIQCSSASLKSATMCTRVDPSTKAPVAKTDVFTPDTAKIYCSVGLANAGPDTEVKAEWVYVRGEDAALTNHVVADSSVKAEGTRDIAFSIERPDDGWPRGDYCVKLYLNGEQKITAPFAVK